MNELQSVLECLEDKFSDEIIEKLEDRGAHIIRIRRARSFQVLKFLKEESPVRFDFLADLTAIDMSLVREDGDFDVVYQLYSTDSNLRIRLKVTVDRDEKVRSVGAIWKVAWCLEREVYDMFGIEFEGHPRLERILLPDNFGHHPLRKEYPVKGLGERDNFPVVERAGSSTE